MKSETESILKNLKWMECFLTVENYASSPIYKKSALIKGDLIGVYDGNETLHFLDKNIKVYKFTYSKTAK